MTHPAIQIRDAVIAVLRAADGFTAENVGPRSKVPRSHEALPYTSVTLGSDDPKRLSSGANATLGSDDEIVLTYMVMDKDDVEAIAFAFDLAALTALANNTLDGKLKNITPGPRLIADREQFEYPCYALQRVFRLQYHTRISTPDTLI